MLSASTSAGLAGLNSLAPDDVQVISSTPLYQLSISFNLFNLFNYHEFPASFTNIYYSTNK